MMSSSFFEAQRGVKRQTGKKNNARLTASIITWVLYEMPDASSLSASTTCSS